MVELFFNWAIVMGQNFEDSMVEGIAIEHDDIAAAKAFDFDVCAHTHDLETLGTSRAGMRLLHLNFVVKLVRG